jgi:hypothetical protein
MSKIIIACLLTGFLAQHQARTACMPDMTEKTTDRDTLIVTYKLNLSTALASGGFVPGDTLLVYSGYFGTTSDSAMTGKPLVEVIGALYRGTDTVVTTRGTVLDYQYYHIQNGKTIREHYYNYQYRDSRPDEALIRQVLVPDTGALTILDTATCFDCARRQPEFENARVLSRNVRVTWALDIRPAIYQMRAGDSLTSVQGMRTVNNPDSIRAWGVFINGPTTGGWGSGNTGEWGMNIATDTSRRMWDDGTHGDLVAGDSIYTRLIFYSPESLSVYSKGQAGQVYKFSIGGGDNECGRGGLGNTHLANLDDRDSTYTVANDWGSINRAFYTAWDYSPHYPLDDIRPSPLITMSVNLDQNYPNPFNPTTTIQYSMPRRAAVTLIVYNTLGQQVAVLVNGSEGAGYHEVKFDGSGLASGVYFYRLQAGNFVQTKELLLLR